jgi:hypothetical protein
MRRVLLLLACCGVAAEAVAQGLPSEPVTFGGGRVVIGGEAAASIAPQDLGFFNYSDYEHSTLREVRLGLTAAVRATDRLSVLAEFRTENFQGVRPFALYARIRPLRDRRLDVQVGRIPPTFGSFTRRAYGHDNPVIGYPLAYQYLTSLRPDAAPANADELLRMRGRGWLSNFSLGNLAPDRGLPIATAFSWDTGIQVSTGWRAIDVTAAVTNGTVTNPRVEDDNGGKQFVGRVSARPTTGLIFGASYARGQFGARPLVDELSAADDRRFIQRAYGADAEYSRDHWMTRVDVVLGEWRIPAVAEPFVPSPLRALALSIEGRYAVLPGAFVGARAEHIAFNRIAATGRFVSWEAPVTRVEIGGGYYVLRNVIVRATVQFNRRDGGRERNATLPAVQLQYWF